MQHEWSQNNCSVTQAEERSSRKLPPIIRNKKQKVHPLKPAASFELSEVKRNKLNDDVLMQIDNALINVQPAPGKFIRNLKQFNKQISMPHDSDWNNIDTKISEREGGISATSRDYHHTHNGGVEY